MLSSMWSCSCCFFFFFKQKTAYEMRISDWSSDVCSSDLIFGALHTTRPSLPLQRQSLHSLSQSPNGRFAGVPLASGLGILPHPRPEDRAVLAVTDRKSVV